MAKKSRTYIWQFVIGLGFLSGLWTAIGIDPQVVILDVLGTVANTIYSDPAIRSLFLILPAILLLLSVFGAYTRGRLPGLISVIVAYLAGLSILVSTMTALVLLGIAIIIGYLAPNRRLIKKMTGT
jgi:energy-converting hydrogenase Eha subunit E